MTIAEVLERIEKRKPNQDHGLLLRWLSNVDSTVKEEIIDTHEGGESIVFLPYDKNTDASTKLLVPSPYDELYLYWLEACIDYENNEIAKYNNAVTRFKDLYGSYQNAYNRQHLPKGKNKRYF